jgi:hypothetical protein
MHATSKLPSIATNSSITTKPEGFNTDFQISAAPEITQIFDDLTTYFEQKKDTPEAQ